MCMRIYVCVYFACVRVFECEARTRNTRTQSLLTLHQHTFPLTRHIHWNLYKIYAYTYIIEANIVYIILI